MAKERSQLAGGISRARVSARPAPRRASSPSALQVMSRKRTSSTWARTRSTAATLSGLEPLRPKDTSRVGRSRCRYSCGWVSRLVVWMARASAGQAALAASAAISAMKPELPAPVKITRTPGRASQGRRKASIRAWARSSESASCRHRAGCWAISRVVCSAPAWPAAGECGVCRADMGTVGLRLEGGRMEFAFPNVKYRKNMEIYCCKYQGVILRIN